MASLHFKAHLHPMLWFHFWTIVKYPWEGIVWVLKYNVYGWASLYVNPGLSLVPLARGWSLWRPMVGWRAPMVLVVLLWCICRLCSKEQWKKAWNDHLVDCCLKRKLVIVQYTCNGGFPILFMLFDTWLHSSNEILKASYVIVPLSFHWKCTLQ